MCLSGRGVTFARCPSSGSTGGVVTPAVPLRVHACIQDLALLKSPEEGGAKPSNLAEAVALTGVAPQTSAHAAGSDALAIATIIRDLASHGVLPHDVLGAPVAAPAAAPVASTNVVKLRGLPWQASTKDIEAFFAPKSLVPKRVVMSLTPAGRPSGHAFVEFEGVAEAAASLELNKQILGGRYIEVFPSTPVSVAPEWLALSFFYRRRFQGQLFVALVEGVGGLLLLPCPPVVVALQSLDMCLLLWCCCCFCCAQEDLQASANLPSGGGLDSSSPDTSFVVRMRGLPFS